MGQGRRETYEGLGYQVGHSFVPSWVLSGNQELLRKTEENKFPCLWKGHPSSKETRQPLCRTQVYHQGHTWLQRLREEDQMSPGRFHLESKMKTWIWLVQVTAIYLQFSEEDANAQNYKTEQEDTESNRVWTRKSGPKHGIFSRSPAAGMQTPEEQGLLQSQHLSQIQSLSLLTLNPCLLNEWMSCK